MVRVGGVCAAEGRMITGDDKRNVKIWDLPRQDPYSLILAHPAPVTDLDFSPTGLHLVTGCMSAVDQPGAARVWDLRNWKNVPAPVLLEHGSDMNLARFQPNTPDTVVTAGNNKLVRFWNASEGRELRTPVAHENIVYSGDFSPGGRYFAFGGRGRAGNQFRVWDMLLGQELPQAKTSGGSVLSFFWNIRFTGEGRLMTDGGQDARLWDIREGRIELLSKHWHTPPPTEGTRETRMDTFAIPRHDGRWASKRSRPGES